ncbi:hypothetical protein [Fischerella sp. PCC 9605]|uniref:hypothetical protein n=1 Tax=Fischerella sp. PCC 9605 TaxID=1173024 RepID=UPI0004B2001C|nr:hypothetical protein [Fischerella sp. PCC 9605]
MTNDDPYEQLCNFKALQVINAKFYVNCSECLWRMLQHNFPLDCIFSFLLPTEK